MTLAVAPVVAPVRPSLRLSQRVRYDYTAPVADLRQRLVVVPPARHGRQRRTAWSLTVSGDSWPRARHPARRSAWHDRFGNLVVEVEVPRVDGWVAFDCRASVAVDVAADAHLVPSDPRYLAPSTLTGADDAVRDVAADVSPGAGAGAGAAEICARTYRAFTYEWGVTGVRTTAAEALAGGRGVCQDYAHVMIAACRVAGIAARYVSGHLVGEGGSHAWVEVLVPDPSRPGRSVVEAWDPTHDRRAGEGYLTVAVGRDYADVAPMSGSYVADAATGHLTVTKRLTRPRPPLP